MRSIQYLAALAFAAGCNEPPAFPVPSGPPASIALDVRLPVYVLGRWTVDGFSETLRLELAKYNIQVVDQRPRAGVVAEVDLGEFTYRTWQSIRVAVVRGDERTPLGQIRVSDLAMTTLDVAAQPVAALIARSVWMSSAAPAEP